MRNGRPQIGSGSDCNPLDFIERDLIARAIIELGRADGPPKSAIPLPAGPGGWAERLVIPLTPEKLTGRNPPTAAVRQPRARPPGPMMTCRREGSPGRARLRVPHIKAPKSPYLRHQN
jgi:hypothetical protein